MMAPVELLNFDSFKATTHDIDGLWSPNIAFVGIDASINETGVCVIRDNHVYTMTVSPPKGLNGFRRCISNAERVSSILKIAHGNSSENYMLDILMEDYAMGIRGGRVFSIGENGGLIKAAIMKSELDYILQTTPPTALKKFTTGSGASDKNVMMKRVFADFGMDIDNDNECDAFALAAMSMANYLYKNPDGPVVVPNRFRSLSRDGIHAYKREVITTAISIVGREALSYKTNGSYVDKYVDTTAKIKKNNLTKK